MQRFYSDKSIQVSVLPRADCPFLSGQSLIYCIFFLLFVSFLLLVPWVIGCNLPSLEDERGRLWRLLPPWTLPVSITQKAEGCGPSGPKPHATKPVSSLPLLASSTRPRVHSDFNDFMSLKHNAFWTALQNCILYICIFFIFIYFIVYFILILIPLSIASLCTLSIDRPHLNWMVPICLLYAPFCQSKFLVGANFHGE